MEDDSTTKRQKQYSRREGKMAVVKHSGDEQTQGGTGPSAKAQVRNRKRRGNCFLWVFIKLRMRKGREVMSTTRTS